MTDPIVPFLRTPDANFDQLANYPFAPHYVDIDGPRMRYLDEGPADGPVALLVHGMPTWSYRSASPMVDDQRGSGSPPDISTRRR